CGAEGPSSEGGSSSGGATAASGGAVGAGNATGTGGATAIGGTGGTFQGSGGSPTGGQGNDDPMDPPTPEDNDSTPPPERPGFTLLFEDHFDTLDTTRWQTASHTFNENAAQFDASMVSVEDGFLR